MTFFLKTDRLLLRSFQDSDVDAFVQYRSHPENAKYQSWDLPYTHAQALAFVAEMQQLQPATPGEWYQVAIVLEKSGVIGDCAFCVSLDSQQAEIGFTLDRAYQGKGYATEAVSCLLSYLFEQHQLHRIYAICDVENQPSVRLLERLKLRREAHFIENIWFKGRWSSEYWYGILRQEWLKNQML
ncbi:MAG: GNAT family protein [Elainellaceae cyanobacterium]